MHLIVFTPLILLGACAATAPDLAHEPAAHVRYSGLALDAPSGRAELRARVATAARGFCKAHEDEITPDALRNDGFYCLERVRDTIVAEMPRTVRDAYRRARAEAGIRGRRL